MNKYLYTILLFVSTFGFSQDLFISEYAEGGSGNNKYLEIYNPTDASVDLTQYAIASVGNASSTSVVH